MQTAQNGIARRVEEILRRTAPGDPLTEEMVAQAHKAFTPPPDFVAAPASGPPSMAIGDIEDDGPRPQRRRYR